LGKDFGNNQDVSVTVASFLDDPAGGGKSSGGLQKSQPGSSVSWKGDVRKACRVLESGG